MNDQSHTALSVIPEVGLTEIDGEPRARDIDIGERLGFSRPRDIRQLIQANLAELEGFGTLARCAAAPIKSGKGRLLEVEEYWLNEEQVLLISSFSKAPQAAAVRTMLIRVFVAWRRGHLTPQTLDTDVLDLLRRTDGISRMLAHKVTEMGKTVDNAMTTLAAVAAVVQPNVPVLIRHGKTAGQIWQAAGFPPVKITSWFSNRLVEAGCLMDGRAEMGAKTVKLFDPDKAEIWLRNGGRLLVQQKLTERMGKGQTVIPFPKSVLTPKDVQS